MRRNSFVTDLCTSIRTRESSFYNPRTGWVYIAWNGADAIGFDGTPVPSREYAGRREVMRFLAKGTHTVSAQSGHLDDITIRAIPQLMHCKLGANPHIREFGDYDWAFLERWVNPHINSMVASGGADQVDHATEWKRRGNRWIVERGMPVSLSNVADPAAIVAWMADNVLNDPTRPDGVLIDEFSGGNAPAFAGYAEAARRIASDRRFDGIALYPYFGGHFPLTDDWRVGVPDAPDNSGHLIRAIFDAATADGERGSANWWVSWERYLREFRHVEDATDAMDDRFLNSMREWRAFYPEAQRKMMIALGYLTITESVNLHPSVDFKVYMDMQLRYLATHEEFDGLAGVYEYLSSYADEESARFAPRLYRHYCIEGNTDLYTARFGWRYNSDIIRNADFEDWWDTWKFPIVEQERSMRAVSIPGYSHLQGRWPRTTIGDTALVMKRRANSANTLSQPLRNIVPGRYYSVKLITGDYGAFVEGRSENSHHGVRILLRGDAEIAPDRSFTAVVPNNYAHTLEPFVGDAHYYFNWHLVVFKATGPNITLTISDWLTDDAPQASVGQEILYNFVEVQPFWIGDES